MSKYTSTMNRMISLRFRNGRSVIGLLAVSLMVNTVVTFAATDDPALAAENLKQDIKRMVLASERLVGRSRITTDEDLLEINDTDSFNHHLALMLNIAAQDAYKRQDGDFHDMLKKEGFTPAASNPEVKGFLTGMYGGVCERMCGDTNVIAIGFRGTELWKVVDFVDDMDGRQHVFPVSRDMRTDVSQADFVKRIGYIEMGFAGYNISRMTPARPDTVNFGALNLDALNLERLRILLFERQKYRENYEAVYGKTTEVAWPVRSHCGFTTQLLDFMRQEGSIKLANGDTLYQALCRARQYPEKYKIIVYGHSLGGAIAKLYACELAQRGIQRPTVYTYGAPPCGDRNLVTEFDPKLDLHEFVHTQDLVGSLTRFFDDLMPPLNIFANQLVGYLADFPDRNYCVGKKDQVFSKTRSKRRGVYGFYYHNEWYYMTQTYKARSMAVGESKDSFSDTFAHIMALNTDQTKFGQKVAKSILLQIVSELDEGDRAKFPGIAEIKKHIELVRIWVCR